MDAGAVALAFILAHPALGHTLVAAGLMAAATPLLRAARVPHAPWMAAVATSFFFYGREAVEAERLLKPVHGDPAAFFLALWPGTWTGGGADLVEWLAPTGAATAVAWLLWRGRATESA